MVVVTVEEGEASVNQSRRAEVRNDGRETHLARGKPG